MGLKIKNGLDTEPKYEKRCTTMKNDTNMKIPYEERHMGEKMNKADQ